MAEPRRGSCLLEKRFVDASRLLVLLIEKRAGRRGPIHVEYNYLSILNTDGSHSSPSDRGGDVLESNNHKPIRPLGGKQGTRRQQPPGASMVVREAARIYGILKEATLGIGQITSHKPGPASEQA